MDTPAPLRISIAGYGRAGVARERCIVAADSGTVLVGIVSRRPLPSAITLSQALEASDALCVCTENSAHGRLVRAALEAGRHCCVEYPLCNSLSEAAELVALAEARRLVLHVEHIELLSAAELNEALRSRIAAEQRARGVALVRVSVSFSGSPLSAAWGQPAWSGYARLTRLLDVVGTASPITVATAAFTEAPAVTDDGTVESVFVASLRAGSVVAEWTETRKRGAPRATSMQLTFNDGAVLSSEEVAASLPAKQVAAKGLFARDLDAFTHKIRAASLADGSVLMNPALVAELEWMALAQSIARMAPHAVYAL